MTTMLSSSLYITGGKGEKSECLHSFTSFLFSPFAPEMYSELDGMVVITALQLLDMASQVVGRSTVAILRPTL